jgi:hypothetical protein
MKITLPVAVHPCACRAGVFETVLEDRLRQKRTAAVDLQPAIRKPDSPLRQHPQSIPSGDTMRSNAFPHVRKRHSSAWLCRFLPTAVAVLLASCATSPGFQRSEPISATAYTVTTVPGATVASPGRHGASQRFVDAPVPNHWWTEFKSDKLTSLIELAHASSPTLAAVEATLRQAQHSFEATAGATQLPQLTAKLGGQRPGTNSAAAGLPGGGEATGYTVPRRRSVTTWIWPE